MSKPGGNKPTISQQLGALLSGKKNATILSETIVEKPNEQTLGKSWLSTPLFSKSKAKASSVGIAPDEIVVGGPAGDLSSTLGANKLGGNGDEISDDEKSDHSDDEDDVEIGVVTRRTKRREAPRKQGIPKGTTIYYANKDAFLNSLTISQKLQVLSSQDQRIVTLNRYFDDYASTLGQDAKVAGGDRQAFKDSFPDVASVAMPKADEADLIKETLTTAKENQPFADKEDKSFALEAAEAYASYLFGNPRNLGFSSKELQKASALYSSDVKTEKKDDFIAAFTQACSDARADIVQHVASLTTDGNVRLIGNDLISTQFTREIVLDVEVVIALAKAVSIDPEVNNDQINEVMNGAIATIARELSIIDLGNEDGDAVDDEEDLKKQEALKMAAAALTQKGATLSEEAKVAAIKSGNIAIIAAIAMVGKSAAEANTELAALIEATTLGEDQKRILKEKAAILTEVDEVRSDVSEEEKDDEVSVQAAENISINEKLTLISEVQILSEGQRGSLLISDGITLISRDNKIGGGRNYQFRDGNNQPILTIKISKQNVVSFYEGKKEGKNKYSPYISDKATLDAVLAQFYTAQAETKLLVAAQDGDLDKIESSITAYEIEKISFGIDENTHLNLDKAFVAASELRDAAKSRNTIEDLYARSLATATAISKKALLEAVEAASKNGHTATVTELLSKVSVGLPVINLVQIDQDDLTDSLVAAAGAGKDDIVTLLATKDPTVRNKDVFKDAFVAAATSGDAETVEALYKASLNGNSSSLTPVALSNSLTRAISATPDALTTQATIIALIGYTAVNDTNTPVDDKVVLTSTQLSEILTAAARSGNVDIINAVYSASHNGAEPSKLTADHLKAAIKAAATSEKAGAVTALLVQANATGANVYGKVTINVAELNTTLNESFTAAVKSGNQDTVAAVYARSIRNAANDADAPSTITEATLLDSLKEASKAGNNDIVNPILANVSLDADANDKVNVASAAFKEALGVSFALAASEGKSAVVATLLAGLRKDFWTLSEASLDDIALDAAKQSKVLLAAVDNGVEAVVTSLLAKYRGALDASEALLAASLEDNVAITTALANHAVVSIDYKGTSENTALYNCISNQVEIGDGDDLPDHIAALLDKNADIFAECGANGADSPIVAVIRLGTKDNLAKAMIAKVRDAKGTDIVEESSEDLKLKAALEAMNSPAQRAAFLEAHNKEVTSKGIAGLKTAAEFYAATNPVKSRVGALGNALGLNRRDANNPQVKFDEAIAKSNADSLVKFQNLFGILLSDETVTPVPAVSTAGLFPAKEIAGTKYTTSKVAGSVVPMSTSKIYSITSSDKSSTIKVTATSDNAGATASFSSGAASGILTIDNLVTVKTSLQAVYTAKAQAALLDAAKAGETDKIDAIVANYNANKLQFGIPANVALDLKPAFLAAATEDKALAVTNLYTKSLVSGVSSLDADTLLSALKEAKVGATVTAILDNVTPNLASNGVTVTTDQLSKILTAAVADSKDTIVTLLTQKDETLRDQASFKTDFIAAATAGNNDVIIALRDASTKSGTADSTIDADCLVSALKKAAAKAPDASLTTLLTYVNPNVALAGVTVTTNHLAEILTEAVNKEQADIIGLLVDKDPTLKTHADFSKAFIDQSKAGNKAVVEALFKASLDATNAATASTLTVDHLSQAIKGAAESEKLDILQDLLGKISSPEDADGKVKFTEEQLTNLLNESFLKAVNSGNMEFIKTLYNRSVRTAPNVDNADRVSLITQDTLLGSLRDAAIKGHNEAIDFLIANATNDGASGKIETPLSALNEMLGVSFVQAVINDKDKAVTAILNKKAVITLGADSLNKTENDLDENQQTKVLLDASANGLTQIITPLVNKYSATIRIDEKDDQGNTTLYNSIAGQTADIANADLAHIPEHIKALIEGGATLNDKDIVKALDDKKPNLASAMVAKAIEVNDKIGVKTARSSSWGKDSADRYTNDLEAARLALLSPETTADYVAKFREKTRSEQLITERKALEQRVQPSRNIFASRTPKKELNKFDQSESAKIKELFSLITTEGERIYDPAHPKSKKTDSKDSQAQSLANSYKITPGLTSLGGTIYKVKKGSDEILRFTIPGSSSQAHFSTNGGKTKTLLTPANENDVIKILAPIYKNDAQNDLLNAATEYGEDRGFVYTIFNRYQDNKKKFGIDDKVNLDLNLAFTGACAAGHLDIAKYLYEQSVSTDKNGVVTSSITDESLLKAIEKAASDGRFDMIEVLLGNKNVSEAKTVSEAGGTKTIAAKAVLSFKKITQSKILEIIKNAATISGNDADRSKIIAALYDKFDSATKNTPELTKVKISAELSNSLKAAASAGHSDVVKLLLGESEVVSGKKVEATYNSKLLSECIIKASKAGYASVAKSLLDKLSTTNPTPAEKVAISLKDLSETLRKSFVYAAANSREAAVIDDLESRMNDYGIDIKIDEATLTEIRTSPNKTKILANVLETSAAKGFGQIVTAVANESEIGSVDAKAKDEAGRAIKQTPLYNCVETLSSDIADGTNLPLEIEALIAKGADIFAVCKINKGHDLGDSDTPIHQAIEGGKSNLAAKMVARAKEVKIEALKKSKGLDAGATIELSEDDRIAFDNAAKAALDKEDSTSTTITQQAAKAFETDHDARVRLNDLEILKETTKLESRSRSVADTLTPGVLRTKTADEQALKEVKTKSNGEAIDRLKLCFDAIDPKRGSSTKFPSTETGSILAKKPKFEISYNKAGRLYSESYVITDYSKSSAKPAKTTITLNKKDGYVVGEGIVVSDAKGTRKLDEKSVSNFIRGLKNIYIAKKQDELLEDASHKDKTAFDDALKAFEANKKQFEISEETKLDLREAYLVAKVNGSEEVISILEGEPYKLTEKEVFGKESEEEVFGKESEGGLGETKISSYLPLAAKNKQYDLLERLSRPEYIKNSDMADSSGNTAIYYLLSEKITDPDTKKKVDDLTKHLLNFATELNLPCKDGDTALHAAIKSENYEVAPRIINMMIGKDINLNIRNNSGETAFDLIARIPNETVRENLLAQSADVIHKARNLDRGSDLLEASKTNHPELLTYLAGKYLDGASAIHVRDSNNNTPLHYISSQRSSNPERSKAIGLATHALLEKGAQPFFKGKDGNTALHLALKSENYVLAALMISKVNALGKTNGHDSLKNFEDIKNDRDETVNDLVGKIKDPTTKANLQSLISKKKVMSPDEVKELVGTLPQVKAKSEGHEAADRLKLKSAAVKGFTGTNTAHVGASEGLNTVINPAPLPSTTVLGSASTVKSPPPKPPKPKAAATSQGNHSTFSVDLKKAVEALSKDSTQKILIGSSGKEFTAKEAVESKLSSVATLSEDELKLATLTVIRKAVVASRNEAAGKKVVENATFDTTVPAERFLRTKYNGIDFTASKSNSFANCEFSGSCNFGNIGGNGNKFVNCTFAADCLPTLPIVAGQFKAENFSQCKFTEGFLDKLGTQRAEFMKALKLDALTPVDGVYTSMTTTEARGTNLLPAEVSKATGKPSTKARQPIESFRLLTEIEIGRVV